jgi:hypothetical protein
MSDNILICVRCDYKCSRRSHLSKHLLSKKHILKSQLTLDILCKFQCRFCKKQYKGQSGLWSHNKKCNAEHNSSVPKNDPQESNIALVPISNSEESYMNTFVSELKKLNDRIEILSNDVNSRQVTPNVQNINNNININLFLNETCKNAVNLDSFINNLMFELADPKLMISNYVDGTCNILQRNLAELPLNKRPLHCMEGEDPNQQLMHIRQDDKWNIGTYVNWLEQIHADDDDDVIDKNPIYYALKTIDEAKLKYLGYNFHQDVEYKLQHGRLNREICRQDLKKDVYNKLLKIIRLEPTRLE